jgi:hypothetical protein
MRPACWYAGPMITATSVFGIAGPIVGFLIWVLVLVWIYNIAKRKGRHAVLWLIFGFFFSLIALIIVALLPSKRTTESYDRA